MNLDALRDAKQGVLHPAVVFGGLRDDLERAREVGNDVERILDVVNESEGLGGVPAFGGFVQLGVGLGQRGLVGDKRG